MSSPLVTPHFARAEFGEVPDVYLGNLLPTAQLLEAIRAIGGGFPLVITSYYRSPEQNAATPGAAWNSEHMTGRAVDFVPRGTTAQALTKALIAAEQKGTAPKYGQWIVYDDGHVHVSLPRPPKENGEKLLAGGTAEHRTYTLLERAEQLVRANPGISANVILLVVVLTAFAYWWARHPMGPL